VDEGFENGKPSGWQFTGSSASVKWQVISNGETKTGTGALYYGNPGSWNYNAGANNGIAETSTFVVPNTPQAKLTFSVWIHIEASASYDKLFLRLMPSGQQLWSKVGVLQQQWVDVSIPLQNFSGQSVQLRWDFNTIDSILNSTKGIFIDDLKVSACDN
jgi:hypothetical protein